MKRIWWYAPGKWSGILPSKESDEYGRHTLAIPTVLFGTFIVAYKNCDCPDMREFACTEPSCPYLAITTGALCLVCDPDGFLET